MGVVYRSLKVSIELSGSGGEGSGRDLRISAATLREFRTEPQASRVVSFFI